MICPVHEHEEGLLRPWLWAGMGPSPGRSRPPTPGRIGATRHKAGEAPMNHRKSLQIGYGARGHRGLRIDHEVIFRG